MSNNSLVSSKNIKFVAGSVVLSQTQAVLCCILRAFFIFSNPCLPAQHFVYVKNIHPGLPLFLFNYSKRQLHGIFEAASPGQMNINPYGWTKDGSERTMFPAQVQICIKKNCRPLVENQFMSIIKGNYYSHSHFRFELDHVQVSKLIVLFSTQVVASSATIPKSIGNWQIVHQNPSEPRTIGNVDPTPCSESNGHSGLSGPSCLDEMPQQIGADIEATEKNETELIYVKLQKLAANCEPLDSCPTSEVQEFGNNNKMHDEYDGSLEGNRAQEENLKENSLLPSDLQSIIAELQELKAFKQEAIDNQKKLLSKVQQLQDRCTRLEALSNQSETYAHGTMEFSSEQLLDPNDSIFLVGGFDGESWLASLDSYSPSKDIIKSLRPMSSVRSHASLAMLNGDLFVIGGGNSGLWYNTVESYNPVNNDWTSLPCLNKQKGGLAATTLYDKIFAIGGGNGIHCFSDVEMFDIDVGRWISARSMLHKRFDLAAADLHGAIYAVGGYDGSEYLSSAERFDPRDHSWSRLGSMNSRRACHSLIVLNEKLYAIGGFDGRTMVASVEVFDPRQGTWMSEAPMNHSRGYSAAVVLNDRIYAFGGMGGNENVLDKVERYQEGLSWQVTNLKAVGKRCFAPAVVVQLAH
ncbi:kelch-like protein 5 isoform X1 [Chenopodium quinoa]|uniref:kelch-like protein 5 isoform X1 n=1 Tax=Chenopodium quinoa TaxID=63459 RepID=UPI000B78F9A0|nr:kelch-like protein 5 isoform X1 [Chenopodium quinoa]